jgi:hypothetical protein
MRCRVIPGDGNGTSYYLQPMFDTWARTVGVTLFPGTVYLAAPHAVRYPAQGVDLTDFVTKSVRDCGHDQRPGFSPRLHPVSLGHCLAGWVYRASAEDPGNQPVEPLGGMPANRVMEVVTTVHVKGALGVVELDVTFLG